MNQDLQNTLYLLSCAVNEKIPDTAHIDCIDLEAVFKITSKHMVSAAVAIALQSAGTMDSSFSQALAKNQRKMVILNNDLAQACSSFEENGIWYMPLKGAILEDFYPRFGMREMADVDILVDDSRADDAKGLLKKLGFAVKSFGSNNVDTYVKPPFSTIEIHKSLFGFQHDRKYYDYYIDIKSRLAKDKCNQYGFHFTPEDFYIYMITHEYKHYKSGGTGLRSLLDTYVFLKKNQVDSEYIKQETEKLGIGAFEEKNRKNAFALFGDVGSYDEDMLNYFFESGVFGNLDHMVMNQIKRQGGGKITYLLCRLFGITKGNYWGYLKQRHPFFCRYKVLLPVLPLYRLIYGICKYPRRIKEEIKAVRRH